jgi:hypothetical protein
MRPVKKNSEGERVRRKDRGKIPLTSIVGTSNDMDKVRVEPVIRGGKPQYVETVGQLLENLENPWRAENINNEIDAKLAAAEAAKAKEIEDKARKKAEEKAAREAQRARLEALGYDPFASLDAEIPNSPRAYLHWDQITPGRPTRVLTYADAISTYPSATTQEELFKLFQDDPALKELWDNSAANQSFYEAQRGAATRRATQVRQEVDRQFPGQGTPGYRMYGYYPWDSNPNLTTTVLRPADHGVDSTAPSQDFLNSTLVLDEYAPVDVHTGKPAKIQPSDPTEDRIDRRSQYSTIHVWNPVDYRGEANNDGVKWQPDVTGWDAPDYVDENGNLHPVSKQRPSMLTDIDEAYRQSRVGRFDAYMNSLMYNSPEEFNDIYGLFQVAKQELPEGMFNDFVASYIERAISPDGKSWSDTGANRFKDLQVGNIATMSAWDRMPGIVQVPIVNPDGSIGSTILNGMSLGSYIDDGIQDNERGKYFTREFTGHPTNEEAYKFFEDYYKNVQPDDRLWVTYPAPDVIRPNDQMATEDPRYIGARKIHQYPELVFDEESRVNPSSFLLNAGNEPVVQSQGGGKGAKVVKRKNLYQAVANRYPGRTFETSNGPNSVKVWNQ